MPNLTPDTEERLARVEADLASLAHSVNGLARAFEDFQKTVLPVMAGMGKADWKQILMIMGSVVSAVGLAMGMFISPLEVRVDRLRADMANHTQSPFHSGALENDAEGQVAMARLEGRTANIERSLKRLEGAFMANTRALGEIKEDNALVAAKAAASNQKHDAEIAALQKWLGEVDEFGSRRWAGKKD